VFELELDGIHWEISVLQSMRSTFSVFQKNDFDGKSDFMSTPQIIMPDGIGWWYYEDEGINEGTSRVERCEVMGEVLEQYVPGEIPE
jgi:hypothetical protein